MGRFDSTSQGGEEAVWGKSTSWHAAGRSDSPGTVPGHSLLGSMHHFFIAIFMEPSIRTKRHVMRDWLEEHLCRSREAAKQVQVCGVIKERAREVTLRAWAYLTCGAASRQTLEWAACRPSSTSEPEVELSRVRRRLNIDSTSNPPLAPPASTSLHRVHAAFFISRLWNIKRF